MEKEGLDAKGLSDLMNKKSGVYGMTGISSDFRDIEGAAANGDAANLDLFHLPKHHAFSGELTAIVEGTCTLTATAKGLKKAIVTIQ